MYEYEKDSEIIGAHCTLLTPYKDTRMERLSVISTTKSLFVSSVAKREY